MLSKFSDGKVVVLERKIQLACEAATGSNKAELQKWLKGGALKEANKSFKGVLNIPTIFSAKGKLNLLDFYYHSKLIKSEADEFSVESIYSFDNDSPTLILGTVGQGKSIFLRWMCFHEHAKGKSIPVFLELRKLRSSTPLIDHVRRQLKTQGLDASEKLLKFLFLNGFVSVFIDGFDEVKFESREGWVNEIESLHSSYPVARVLITSRPDTEIHQSHIPEIYSLKPLDDHDHPGFIRCLVSEEEDQAALISKITEAESEIRGLLKTPLLMTLFVSVYQNRRKLPRYYSEFFDELFSAIMSRHDGIKSAYDRPNRTGLSDKRLRSCLDALCYQTRKSGETVFSEGQLIAISDLALKVVDCSSVQSKDFIYDLKNITCLLQKEGIEYKFIHDSVQEYFAASFVKGQEEQKVKFYEKYLDDWHDWYPELNFLRYIDEFSFKKYFLIPSINRVCEIDGLELLSVKKSACHSILSSTLLLLSKQENKRELNVYKLNMFDNWALNQYFVFFRGGVEASLREYITAFLVKRILVGNDSFDEVFESEAAVKSSESGISYLPLDKLVVEDEMISDFHKGLPVDVLYEMQDVYRSSVKFTEHKKQMAEVF